MANPPAPLRLLLLASAGLLAGCADDDAARPEVFPVSGRLLVNGEPAGGARLVFHPASDADFDDYGTRPFAVVQPDGTFQLTTYEKADGAPAGDYRVSVVWIADPDSTNAWDKLGRRYADPDRSDISVTVQPEPNQLEPLEITGARVLEQRPGPPPQDIDQVDG